MAMAFSLLRRNGGLEDHATMSRLASGKKWDYQRYNGVLCKACQGDFRGPSHPLLKCSNIAISTARNLWLANCKEHIKTVKPPRMRKKLSEYYIISGRVREVNLRRWVRLFQDGWLRLMNPR